MFSSCGAYSSVMVICLVLWSFTMYRKSFILKNRFKEEVSSRLSYLKAFPLRHTFLNSNLISLSSISSTLGCKYVVPLCSGFPFFMSLMEATPSLCRKLVQFCGPPHSSVIMHYLQIFSSHIAPSFRGCGDWYHGKSWSPFACLLHVIAMWDGS